MLNQNIFSDIELASLPHCSTLFHSLANAFLLSVFQGYYEIDTEAMEVIGVKELTRTPKCATNDYCEGDN